MVTTVKKAPPLPPATRSFHRLRKAVHLVCFLIFLALPFLDVMRFDIPRQRFYFAGYELWINEFGIIFFALMFLMFVVVASSVLYGRVYCGYLCPQMIFSEASLALENRLKRWFQKHRANWSAKQRNRAAMALFYLVLAVCSVFLAFVFVAYFVEPRDLLARLRALDVHTAGGISGAAVTLITFLDFTLVRQRFCTTVCPYGYLQGMLGDQNTLLVTYHDEQQHCIECKKCVRVCQMGIDIRKSPFQIECVHCGDCIDACEDVLRRIGREGLIHYTWGEHEDRTGRAEPWHRRLGIRDAKRVVVLLVLLFYASGLYVALSMRRNVLVRLAPVRTVLYRRAEDGSIRNQFRYSLANRGRTPAAVVFTIHQLPGATLLLAENPIRVAPGATAQGEFEIAVRPAARFQDVNHFTVVAASIADGATDTFPMTFLMPAGGAGEEHP
ncbi:MAG TPA: 4Fe-4S dicluster domain-containing protein [Bryobacteraceae bacterium]|nr:4Fe-4S dicluster domain-containing protein [Bryobacteraceae bacterium]